ncbi:hypothetical protein AGMMS50276_29550 [Synergistales bacterium]|nr:hypothetical protein AGMMS50276_29550 [Synergistales bacterium]
MVNIAFEPLRKKHVVIAQYLREADKKEIEDMARVCDYENMTPEMAVEYSIKATPFGYAAFVNGELAAIFGISGEPPSGNIWLLGTDKITDHPLAFYFESKRVFLGISIEFDELYNWVGVENTLTLRWLEWLGFEILSETEGFRFVRWKRKCAP